MAHILKDKDVIDTFWDMYTESGITAALDYAKSQANGNLTILEGAVPYLVDEARNREIKIMDFLKELDQWYLEQVNDTDGASIDGGSVPDVVANESSEDEDGTECPEVGQPAKEQATEPY